MNVIGGSMHTHDFVLSPAALGPTGHFVNVIGSNRNKVHIVLASSAPVKNQSDTVMCRRVVQIKSTIKGTRWDDADVCRSCGDNAITARLGEREETPHFREWKAAAMSGTPAREGPPADQIDLFGMMPEVVRLLGGSWRYEHASWMDPARCDLVNRYSDRIHLEYHQFDRWAGQVVAFMVLDGTGYDLAAALLREQPRANIPADRGARGIVLLLKSRLLPWCEPED